MSTLGDASLSVRMCERFLQECPKNKYAPQVQKMLAAAEQARQECLDYLATH